MGTKMMIKADKNIVYTKEETDKKVGGNQGYTKAEVDTKLNGKTDKTAVYTKEETDKKLAAAGGSKPAAPGYTKEEVDTKLKAALTLSAGAAGSSAGNNQADTDKKFELKADKVSVYTRDEIDKKLGLKEDKGSLQMLAGMLEAKPEADDVYTKAEADAIFALKATFAPGDAAQGFWPEDGGQWLAVTVNSRGEGGGYNVSWEDGSRSDLIFDHVRKPQ